MEALNINSQFCCAGEMWKSSNSRSTRQNL